MHIVVLCMGIGGLIATPVLACASENIIFAQAGSTGGSIGKQGKSASGGGEAPAPRRSAPPPSQITAPAPAASPCAKIPGVWSWFIGPDVTFHAGGKLTSPLFNATWSCDNGKVVISWSHGFVDRLTLSADGTHLSGTNQAGTAVSGIRK